MNCWSLGIFFIFFLASFCIWNCFKREQSKSIEDWYGCFDQQGKPTDFSIIYKLPKDHNSSENNLQNGLAYIYLTPDSSARLQSGGVSSVLSYSDSASEWILSNYSINEKQSMPAKTMRRLYYDPHFKNVAAYFLYNDESPDGSESLAHGHTKGVVILSDHGGMWLIHSVPKYPPFPKDGYSYPSTGQHYGQSILCVSLPPLSESLADNISWQLIENDVRLYSWNLPEHLSSKFPILKKIVNGKSSTPQPPFYRISKIPTFYGKSFTSFAKHKHLDDDLYSRLVAPFLKTSLFVESWRNGPHPLPSFCNSTYQVENVESIYVKTTSFEFTTHHDHSKWAVAQHPDKPYVCIGDINRMATQFDRGGGTMCIWSLSIWYRFRSLIKNMEGCPKIEFNE